MQWVHKHTQRGFTIVELLIVVVVIALLAAITIVAYNGVTQRARAAAAQNAAKQGADKIETVALTNGSIYPVDLTSAGLASSNGTTYEYSVNNTTNPAGYCLTATVGSTSYYYSNNFTYTGAIQNTLTVGSPTAGSCPGHGLNGNAAVTNLLTNPSVETGTSNWAAVSSTISQSTTQKHSGINSLKVVTAGSVSAEGAIATVPVPGSLPGNTYSGGVWVWASTGSQLYVVVRTVGAVAQDSPQTIVNGNSAWQFVTANGKLAQSDANSLQIHVRTKSVQATTFYVDDAIIIQSNQVNGYNDGNSTNWVWNGTQNGSTSTGPPA